MHRGTVPAAIEKELSAVASRPCPRSIRKLAPDLAEEAARVADIGCGYLAGTAELIRFHRQVYAIDTSVQRKRIAARLARLESMEAFRGFRSDKEFSKSRLRLGGGYVINVLHTLPTAAERVAVLRSTYQNLRLGGFAVVDVPSYEHYYSQRMGPENVFGDGYVFRRYGNRYSFYRFCTADDLDLWASNAGLSFDRAVPDHHHIVRVYRRVGPSR